MLWDAREKPECLEEEPKARDRGIDLGEMVRKQNEKTKE